MSRTLDVAVLDRHIAFLKEESSKLRPMGAAWATRKADQFDKIAELLRQLRQDQQMGGIGGKRIE
jgi:hypothetical protein